MNVMTSPDKRDNIMNSRRPDWAIFAIIVAALLAGVIVVCQTSHPRPYQFPANAIIEYDDITNEAPYYLKLGSGVSAYYDIYFKDYELSDSHIVLTTRYLCPRTPGQHDYWIKQEDLFSRPMPSRYDSGIREVAICNPKVTERDIATIFESRGWDPEEFRSSEPKYFTR